MSSPIDFSSSLQSHHSIPTEGIFLPKLDKINDLITWLNNVQYHAKSGSREDMASLYELSESLPEVEIINPEVQRVINTLQNVAATKLYNRDLTTQATEAITVLSKQFPLPVRMGSPNHTIS